MKFAIESIDQLLTERDISVWARGAVIALACALFAIAIPASAHDAETLTTTISHVKPSVVGIGTYSSISRPPRKLMGTGFVIGNGRYVATNEHVIPDETKLKKGENLVVFIGSGRSPKTVPAKIVATDKERDLAILEMSDMKVNPLQLGADEFAREGLSIALTGFPIGAVLGLYPVTHTGIISAITPDVIPARSARELSASQIRALRDPYLIYQLDAVAYPGNSGSPLYDVENGIVVGIINKVFVKKNKENILSDPSAITYAIPIKYLKSLLATVTSQR